MKTADKQKIMEAVAGLGYEVASIVDGGSAMSPTGAMAIVTNPDGTITQVETTTIVVQLKTTFKASE